MGIEFCRATSSAEIQAVQRLRYTVYVEEMHRYASIAESAERRLERRLVEPEDEYSWICYARDGADVVAATRMTWGRDGLSDRQIDQYQLSPFLDELPADLIGVGERNTVLAAYRGTGVLDQLLAHTHRATDVSKLRVIFGCCEPHLLPMYLKMGQRTYAARNINSPEAGYLIPLVAFIPDVDALRGLGMNTPTGALAQCVQRVLDRTPSVHTEALSSPNEYWQEIRRTLDELDGERISIFDGLTESEVARCVTRSSIIECSAGDRVVKRGGSARNMFVVLRGTLEVVDGDTIVNVLSQGDAFGEVGFLLERPRSLHVDAATDASILSLSEGALRTLIADDSEIAAKLLLNLARVLCVKLVRSG